MVGGRTVSNDLAGLDLLPLADDWPLIEASARVRAHELAQFVNEGVVLRISLRIAGQFAVLGDHDAFRVNRSHNTGLFGHNDNLRVTRHPLLDTSAHEWGLGLQQRYPLALHVGTHERTICVVVL